MSEFFNEVFGAQDTQKQTPIEIALGVDSQGMTTATKLYEFLELNMSNYAKWYKRNVQDNGFAEENVDYFPFVLQYESLTGEKERQDARLTASFAKKLSMMQKNQKGEAARNYFIGVESGAKKMVNEKIRKDYDTKATSLGEVASYVKEMDKRLDKQGTPAWKVCEAFKQVSEQFGIELPDDFVRVPEYEQIIFTGGMRAEE